MGWIDWFRYVLAPLLIAAIGAAVATRNARKTPHERLKNLVDINEKMPKDLDPDRVVQAAIARELVDFDRRVAADQRGFWAGLRERVVQFPSDRLGAALVVGFAGVTTGAGFLLLLRPSTARSSTSGVGVAAYSVLLTLIAGAVAFYVAGRSTRDARRVRQKELEVATLAVQVHADALSRRLAELLSTGNSVPVPNKQLPMWAETLTALGYLNLTDHETGAARIEATLKAQALLEQALRFRSTDPATDATVTEVDVEASGPDDETSS